MAAILDFCTFACVEVFNLDFFEFLIHQNSCVDTRMNVLGAFKRKVMNKHIFFMLAWRSSQFSVNFIAFFFFFFFLNS